LPSTTAKRSQWVVSRALCLYELVDLRNVSKEDRSNALDFHIKKNSPFASTGFHCEWKNAFAMVWIWNKATVNTAIDEQAINAFEILPETVLREKPTNGIALLPTLDDGYDIQFWVNDILLSSSYFSNTPDEASTLDFIKGIPRFNQFAFDLPKLIKPQVVEAPIQQTPWKGSSSSNKLLKGLNFEPTIAFIILISALSYIQWQTIGSIKASSALENLEESIELAFDKARPIANAREKALDSQQKFEQTNQLIDFPDQLKLMSSFGQLIAEKQGQLKRWQFRLDKLELTVESKNNNSLEYVNSFQALKTVQSVSTEPVNKTNRIKIIINLRQ